MTPRVVAIIQARMTSSRLPGKVLSDVAGKPMLQRVVDRTARSSIVDEVLVATTTEATDDALARHCASLSWPCWRGSEYDVLDRYYQAARARQAEIIVRITADCPLIDAGLIDETILTLLGSRRVEPRRPASPAATAFDFAANRLPPPRKRTYPIGLDTEVCTFAALERAWREAAEAQEREHVMPYLYEDAALASVGGGVWSGGTPRGFRVAILHCEHDYGAYRWTVDTAQDLEFVRQVYTLLGDRIDFSWRDVLALVQSHPELTQINANVVHRTLRDVDERAKHR